MTLIELLVVIVILTTLVAGVLPVLSPNNDARKIREATRGLQTYISMAQAEAARTGRPQGIAFGESAEGLGVALEVFRLEVPPPFAGFSSTSRVVVERIPDNGGSPPHLYGNVSDGNNGVKFSPKYDGAQLYRISFVLAASSAPNDDPFPPRMFRIGDQIHVEGNVFLIVDDNDDIAVPNPTEYINDVQYLVPDPGNTNPTECILLNDTGQIVSDSMKQYKIVRQAAPSIEPPYQFPSGIAIDLQGSVVEGSSTGGFPTDASLYDQLVPFNYPNIMFSPTGSVDSVSLNNTELSNPSRIVLLVGRVENAALDPAASPLKWTIADTATDDELENKQEEINWLNLDSRWVSIAVNSGRVVVSENGYVDARDFGTEVAFDQAIEQIEAAHELAHGMKSGGAR